MILDDDRFGDEEKRKPDEGGAVDNEGLQDDVMTISTLPFNNNVKCKYFLISNLYVFKY